MFKKLVILIICFSSLVAASQKTITGTVFDEYLEPFPGATISSPSGSATSDYDGVFTLAVSKFPVNLTITSVGYATENVLVESLNDDLNIILKETYALDQVVISASRTPERVMESPVTIERADNKFIKNTASPNFYEGLRNLKGIDILDNNYLTKTVVSNRGFANTDNVRFVQLIDGVDSAVPVFDYSLGNIFGLNELDVQNIEILPGAASALYGANAFNGILLMTSKNPFEHQGISTYIKTGVTSQESVGNQAFYDVGIRMAYKFNDWFAGKVNFSYEKAEDWVANDFSNINGGSIGHGNGNSNYDGVNIYGDDFSVNLVDVTLNAFANGLISDPEVFGALQALPNATNVEMSRTGIKETDLVDYGMKNLKFDASLHFKPWGEDKTEIILGAKYSLGDNISQASNRYSQSNSKMEQYKFEFKGKQYFVRGYYTGNDAGDTYDTKLAAVYMNRQASGGDVNYFASYLGGYYNSLLSGNDNATSHDIARNIVDTAFSLDPDSDEFKRYFKEAKSTDISKGGAKLTENSGYYHVDANLNLAEEIDFADIQIGGSFRSFGLKSNGQVYTDYDGVLRYRQYGLYTQLQKKFLDERLKFTGTVRYDKSKNFEGNISPRATLSYAAGDKKDHNFRVGFQTGFRNPTSQDQYSGLLLGGNTILLGSVEDNLDRYEVTPENGGGVVLTGNDAFNNSITAKSLEAFQEDVRNKILIDPLAEPTTLADESLLDVSNFETVQPEIVRSFELGYRGATNVGGNLFEFDVVGYYNFHKDFITSTEVVVPYGGDVNSLTNETIQSLLTENFQRFVISTNAESTINAYGLTVGFNTKLFNTLNFGASYAFSDFSINENEGDSDIDFVPAFNTPKHAVKVQLGGERLFKKLGFGIDLRWQDEYLYQTRFLLNRYVDARFVVDAQINYSLPSIKSVIKIGGTNLTGKEYASIPEAGTIGSQYYISWVINN